MKEKICGTVAVLFIVVLTLLNVQATKYSGNLALDDLTIMAAEENVKLGYPMGCNYAWEAFFCYPHEDGDHCRRGIAVGEFCNDGQSEHELAP